MQSSTSIGHKSEVEGEFLDCDEAYQEAENARLLRTDERGRQQHRIHAKFLLIAVSPNP